MKTFPGSIAEVTPFEIHHAGRAAYRRQQRGVVNMSAPEGRSLGFGHQRKRRVQQLQGTILIAQDKRLRARLTDGPGVNRRGLNEYLRRWGTSPHRFLGVADGLRGIVEKNARQS